MKILSCRNLWSGCLPAFCFWASNCFFSALFFFYLQSLKVFSRFLSLRNVHSALPDCTGCDISYDANRLWTSIGDTLWTSCSAEFTLRNFKCLFYVTHVHFLYIAKCQGFVFESCRVTNNLFRLLKQDNFCMCVSKGFGCSVSMVQICG